MVLYFILYIYLIYGLLVFICHQKAELLIQKVTKNADDINIIDYGIRNIWTPGCAFAMAVLLYNIVVFVARCIVNKSDSFYISSIVIFSFIIILILYFLICNEFMKIIILTDNCIIITSKKNKENNYIKEKIDFAQIQSVKYRAFGSKLTINLKTQEQIVISDFTKTKKIYKYLDSIITK